MVEHVRWQQELLGHGRDWREVALDRQVWDELAMSAHCYPDQQDCPASPRRHRCSGCFLSTVLQPSLDCHVSLRGSMPAEAWRAIFHGRCVGRRDFSRRTRTNVLRIIPAAAEPVWSSMPPGSFVCFVICNRSAVNVAQLVPLSALALKSSRSVA